MKKSLPLEVYKGTKIIYADTLVDNGYKIKGTQKTLEVIKLSETSQEKSDIAIYSKDDDFLYVGNIVFTQRLVSYKESSDIDAWIEAIHNLVKIDAKCLFTGHGNEYDKNSYKVTLEYLQILRDNGRKAYENDVDILDLESHVNTQKFNYLEHFEISNRVNIKNYYNQLLWE